MAKDSKILKVAVFPQSFFTQDYILKNFYTACDKNPQKALKMWEDWVKWYSEYQPLKITLDQISEFQDYGVGQVIGQDRQGRATIVVKPHRIDLDKVTIEQGFKNIVYTFEKALRKSAENGQTQVITIHDRKYFNVS